MMIKKRHLIILIVMLIIIVVLTFIPRKITVFGYSMIPVLSDGYKVMVTPYVTYKLMGKSIERGDLVVVKTPEYTEGASPNEYQFQMESHNKSTQTVIKRVVALPGDTVRIDTGLLYVNDELTQHNDINAETHDEIVCDGYYLLGDNSYVSIDSRYYGCIDESDIKYVVTHQDKYTTILGLAESLLPEQEG